MQVEQAIKHTVGRYTAIARGDVEVRPRRHAADSEATDLEARIRNALPVCEPPIDVEIGPPVGDDDRSKIAGPPEERSRHHQERPDRSETGKEVKKGKN